MRPTVDPIHEYRPAVVHTIMTVAVAFTVSRRTSYSSFHPILR